MSETPLDPVVSPSAPLPTPFVTEDALSQMYWAFVAARHSSLLTPERTHFIQTVGPLVEDAIRVALRSF